MKDFDMFSLSDVKVVESDGEEESCRSSVPVDLCV